MFKLKAIKGSQLADIIRPLVLIVFRSAVGAGIPLLIRVRKRLHSKSYRMIIKNAEARHTLESATFPQSLLLVGY